MLDQGVRALLGSVDVLGVVEACNGGEVGEVGVRRALQAPAARKPLGVYVHSLIHSLVYTGRNHISCG